MKKLAVIITFSNLQLGKTAGEVALSFDEIESATSKSRHQFFQVIPIGISESKVNDADGNELNPLKVLFFSNEESFIIDGDGVYNNYAFKCYNEVVDDLPAISIAIYKENYYHDEGENKEIEFNNNNNDKEDIQSNVVALIGSTRYKDKFQEIAKKETLKGNIVLAPTIYSHTDGDTLDNDEKILLLRLGLDRIKMADKIIVISPNDYGESTSKELGYAKLLSKPIEYYNEEEE